MADRPAIRLHGVSKHYPLFGSPVAQALGYLGVRRARSTKCALDSVDVTIGHGEKVGVVGRNGSGKTTLLKLVIGHTQATTGRIDVDGAIQAMMQGGFGFHDDLTGRENIANTLLFNGLDAAERDAASADIVSFVELGDFIDHPLKTYSLGMRARLEFATATAIHPDILAIDEVLGAGDGYFVKKCAERMRNVIADGTLLLVSHSLDQIAEYCNRVIWLDNGQVVKDGPTASVIRAYQRFMSKHEAGVQGEIRDRHERRADESDDLHDKARLAVGRAHDLFGAAIDASVSIHTESHVHIAETGEPLAIRVALSGSGDVQPVLLGFSEHGAYVFEASAPTVTTEGVEEVSLRVASLGVGVGNYVVVPALRDATGTVIALAKDALILRMMPTNWSDPPLVHLDGAWHAGDVPLSAKISAWV